MKKNRHPKLQLSRETLKHLQPEQLDQAVGGRPCQTGTWHTSEPTCILC